MNTELLTLALFMARILAQYKKLTTALNVFAVGTCLFY
jgi:uncharacterized membrane protein YgdD (TMEM256/DUF423 family)